MEFTKDIYLNTDKLHENSSLVLLYSGILAKDPEAKVYLRYGYNDTWDNADELRLKRTETGMLGVLRLSAGNSFRFAFRDGNNNWDNNNNQDYSLPILEKEDTVLEFGPSEVENIEESNVPNVSEEFEFQSADIIETDIVAEDKAEPVHEDAKTFVVENSMIPAGTLINKVVCDNFTKEINISEFVIVGSAIDKAVQKVDEESGDLFVQNENSAYAPIRDFNFIEDYSFDSHSLVPQNESSLSGASFFSKLKRSVKLAFVKFFKLVKTALRYNEDKNY